MKTTDALRVVSAIGLSLQSKNNTSDGSGSSNDTSGTNDVTFTVLAIIFIGCVLAIIAFVCKARHRKDSDGNSENFLCCCLRPSYVNENCDPCITLCDEHCCYFCSLRSFINSTDRLRYFYASSSSSYAYTRTIDEKSEYTRADLNSPNMDNKTNGNSFPPSSGGGYSSNIGDNKRTPSKKFVLDDDIWDESIEIGIVGANNQQQTSSQHRMKISSGHERYSSINNDNNSESSSISSNSSSNINSGSATRDSKDTINALHSI